MTRKRKPTHLKGMGACAGTATGTVKYVSWADPKFSTRRQVARRAEQLAEIKEGDVVVTRMTTPEIMPHIKKVVGLVTEVGGIVCHAAIVAREFNIPTVIACSGAVDVVMRRRSPTPIVLNGMTGEVVLDGQS